MNVHSKNLYIHIALLLFGICAFWQFLVLPHLEKLPSNFQYQAEVVSYDNFYDEKVGDYSGENRSVSRFAYNAVSEKHGMLVIKNSFDVQKVTGEQIFSVERLYGIDSKTGKHMPGFGDRNREGYLFAPRHLQKGKPYTYWHINYDAAARLIFSDEEELFGLPVYRYETHYEGVTIDQTKNLGFLPHVGTTRGVQLKPHLQVWIEPISGHMVKYTDDTVAYYYDLKTGVQLQPWNHFRNSFSSESVQKHVRLAREEKMRAIILEWIIPGTVFLVAIMLLLLSFYRMKIMKFVSVVLLIGSIVIIGIVVRITTQDPTTENLPPLVEKIRIGAETGLLASVVWIADYNGYFHDEGLDVDIQEFPSGRAAFNGLLNNGNLDIATVAQTPLALNSLKRNDFAIVAGMVSSSNDVKIIARKDRGIHTILDLKGKKIGVTKNSTGHYFLALLLTQHGLQLADVSIADFEATLLSQALRDGQIDAISTWEPHIYNAKNFLQDNGLVFESKGTFREDFYFAAFKDWAKTHHKSLIKFLTAIDKAESFIAKHPLESQKIMSKKLQIDPQFVNSVWEDYAFRLFLDQAIVLSLEHQARWMLSNTINDKTAVPNYLDYIFFEALEAVKPEAVSIIQ